MSSWSDVGSTYADAVQGLFPLHRACIFMFGLTASLVIEKDGLNPMIKTVLDIKLSEVVSLSDGFFKDATILNVAFGCFSVVFALIFSACLTRCLYFLINKSQNVVDKAMALDRGWVVGLSVEDRKGWVDLIDQSISDAKARVQNFSAVAEFFSGLFVIFFVSSFWTFGLDLWISIPLFFIAVVFHGIKMYIFFDDFFGPALTKAHLQGKSLPKIPSS